LAHGIDTSKFKGYYFILKRTL